MSVGLTAIAIREHRVAEAQALIEEGIATLRASARRAVAGRRRS